jgi:ATP-dependent Clp protease ATP-binding subunit ClpC
VKFDITLYGREHMGGAFTLCVLEEPSLQVYGDDLDAVREELELALHDRLERSHPGALHRYASPENLRHEELEVENLLAVHRDDGRDDEPSRLTVLAARDRAYERLYYPRLAVHQWVPAGTELEPAAEEFLGDLLERLSDDQRLRARWERREWLETLSIEVAPADPVAFTGLLRHATILPEPAIDEDDEEAKKEEEEKKKKKVPTPTLDKVAVNLRQLREDGELPRAHRRDKETRDLLARVSAKGAAIAVVGVSGVGKTALLDELVHHLPPERPVFFADAGRLIAGEGFFGEWQRQCLDLVEEAIEANVILYLGPLLPLVDAGKSAYSEQNVAGLLKPILSGRRITVIAEATPRQWAQLELRDAGFWRLFAPYRLEEPAEAEVKLVIEAVADEIKSDEAVTIEPDAQRAVLDLCRRYGSAAGSLLGASLHFLRRLADDARARRIEAADPPGKPMSVRGRDAVDRFCVETGMPAFIVRDDLPLDPAKVHAHFRSRIVGQDEPVRRMADLVSVIKAGLGDLNRPLGSFLFVGPTGVGKTEMAKALAEFLFGRRERMLRYDMSEFYAADSVHRFLGSAGSDTSLVAAVRRAPFTLLLLDEVEKAHPAVFDVLLQMLGEARLTDHAGRTADFRNVVVVMTSNLGVDTMGAGMGFGDTSQRSLRDHFVAECERFFRPEFMGRLDHIVAFESLTSDDIGHITGRQLALFEAREGLRGRKLGLELDPGVSAFLAERGIDAKYGARPLQRAIERELAAPLARHLSTLDPNHRRVAVAPGDDALVFRNLESKEGEDSGDAELLGLVRAVGATRLRVGRWLRSRAFREVAQRVRLLDRLSQDRNFWRNKETAEARMARSGNDRQVCTAFEEAGRRLDGLEDLAYESWFDSDPEPLPLLDKEHHEVRADLDRLELALYAQTRSHPNRAVLYLKAGFSARGWIVALVHAYTQYALDAGFEVHGITASLDPDYEPPAKQRRSAAVRNPDMWRWFPMDSVRGSSDARAAKRLSHRVVDGPVNPESVLCYALAIEGTSAAAPFADEGGTHMQIGASDTEVAHVLVSHGSRSNLWLPNALADKWTERRRRTVHRPKRQVQDAILGKNVAWEPRLDRIYGRLMRAAIHRAVLGEGAAGLVLEGS